MRSCGTNPGKTRDVGLGHEEFAQFSGPRVEHAVIDRIEDGGDEEAEVAGPLERGS